MKAPSELQDHLLNRLVVPRPLCVGVVSAVIRNDEVLFRSYGESGDPARQLDEDAIFDIGSITKVFTGILLAEMVERGEVALEDPLSHFLPEGSHVPSQGERSITLVDLATHTSGLPRLAPNQTTSATFDSKDPYAHMDEKHVLEGLSQAQITGTVGETTLYSNFGFEVLGLALGNATRSTYPDLLRERVAEPLRLKSTEIWVEPLDDPRLVPGHDDFGERTPFWRSPVPGDGGIVSTARDLATFIQANLKGAEGTLGKALESARMPRVPAGGALSHGLGWVIDDGREGVRYYWHNGGVGGYGSFLAMEISRRVGVVLLANSHHSSDLDRAGVKLLDALCDEE